MGKGIRTAEDHAGFPLGRGIEHFESQCGGFGIGQLPAFQLDRHLRQVGGIDPPKLQLGGQSFALAVAFDAIFRFMAGVLTP